MDPNTTRKNSIRKDRTPGTRLLALLLAALLTVSLAACTETPPPEPEPAPDTTAPEILGVRNLETLQGTAPSYRDGVSATDETDGALSFAVDTSAVDLDTPGHYEVVYTATDSAGNRTRKAVTLTVNALQTVPVEQEPEEDIEEPIPDDLTEEMIWELADKVLEKITNDEMDLSAKAWAIYNWTLHNLRYVGTSDKSSWIVGAYVGFVRGKGDCFNFFAVAKALLNRAGIETVDLERIPSKTRHYWLLANIGTGWYHFDACPHPTGYPLQSFFLTEQEVRDYSQEIGEAGVRENYFIYDYANCFVKVEGTPEGAETEYGWYLLENGLIEDPNGETNDTDEPVDTPDETDEQNEQNEQIDTPDETGEQNGPDETGDETGTSEENDDQTEPPEETGETAEGEPEGQ